jgi:hypothetical protein
MSDLADYIEDNIIDHIFRNQAFTPATTLYMALFTTATADAETGTEVPNTNAYARTAINLSAASGGATSNGTEIAFPTASGGNWGTVTHIALVDSNTWGAGNWYAHGALTASKAVNDTDTFKIAVNDLDLDIA